MKEQRFGAHGAVAHGKIFVIGGSGSHVVGSPDAFKTTCEMYDETTTEWQLIANLNIPRYVKLDAVLGMVCLDDKLYALGKYSVDRTTRRNNRAVDKASVQDTSIKMQCYDRENNEWQQTTDVPTGMVRGKAFSADQVCALRVLKGSQFLKKVSPPLTS